MTAEHDAIGTVLAFPETWEYIAPLGVEAFEDPLARIAYETIAELADAGDPVSAATAAARIVQDRPHLNPHLTLFEWSQHTVASQAEYFAQIIREAYARRRLVELGEHLRQHAGTTGAVDDLTDHARTVLDGTAARPDSARTAASMFDDVLTELEAPTKAVTMQAGLIEFDELVKMRPGQLIVIGARPGQGKTTLMTDLARHNLLRGMRVHFWSLEMTTTEIGQKMLSAHTGVGYESIIEKDMTDDQWKRVMEARADLEFMDLRIEDSPHVTVSQIRTLAVRHKPDLIIVDYLQRLTVPGQDKRYDAVSTASRGLADLAKDTGAVVVAGAQLNRASRDRASKAPSMADLRESGQIEADAHTVILLHRPDQDDQATDRVGEIDVIVAKQRAGRTGVRTLLFQGGKSRFANIAPVMPGMVR